MRMLTFLAVTIVCLPAWADESPKGRQPDQYAIIFLMGYAGDHFPADDEGFERLIVSVKKAHFNVILCQHTAAREAICKKHGMKLMVDLLVPDHHIYKNVAEAEKLCRSLRDSETIYAYHLWSDRVGGTAAGRMRDVKNVQTWDPNHAAYVGDYHARSMGQVENADIIGYYDFHWKRGGHFRHLMRAWTGAKKIDAPFLRYTHANPGLIGKGNPNRVLYTISTANACGQKGYLYHWVGGLDVKTGEWGPLMHDLAKVNGEVVHLGGELMKIGLPTAIYSTPISKTAKDDPVETPAVPGEFPAVPEDSWVQVAAGEVLLSQFAEESGETPLALANHNAYQTQAMKLTFARPPQTVRMLDRASGAWKELKLEDGSVAFEVAPAACELVRVKR